MNAIYIFWKYIYGSIPLIYGLNVNDKVKIFGGYDAEPEYLSNNDYYTGRVTSFIPGQNNKKAAIVKLDNQIKIRGLKGDIFILDLRFVGSKWRKSGIVHLEFCDFVPEAKSWKERKKGIWIESHAQYKAIYN